MIFGKGPGGTLQNLRKPQAAAAWEGDFSKSTFKAGQRKQPVACSWSSWRCPKRDFPLRCCCLSLVALALCYDSPVLRHTGLASRIAKAQQAERRICVIGFFHVLMLREATRFIQISTARFSRMVRFWQAVWGTREGAPVLCPVRQPARACLPLIGVEGGRF